MKLIEFLLRLYPEEFRARYGREMRAFHDERKGEARAGALAVIVDHVRSACAEQLRALGPDVRLAVRGLVKRKLFALVVIATIALGVGANTAMFSVVNGVLLRPLPYDQADRLVAFTHEPPQWLVSEPQLAEYRRSVRSFDLIAAYTMGEANIAGEGEAERVATASVTRSFFTALGVNPLLGRVYDEGEDAVRPSPVVVISHAMWQRTFGGRTDVIGREISINGVTRSVIGVMPAGFDYPTVDTRVWFPMCSLRTCASLDSQPADSLDGWVNHYLFLLARVRPGVTLEQARAEATSAARQIMREQPDYFDAREPLTPKIATLHDALVGGTRPYLIVLLCAVGVVLLIACANVANLLLSRGEGRRREMALRVALGASRHRLTTQLLTESLVLAALGGIAGLGLAWIGTRVLIAAAPASLPRLELIGVDWAVVSFALIISLVAGLMFGVVPALRASAEAPADALQGAGKGQHDAGGTSRSRRALVIAQLALSMMLLSAAGMLLRSAANVHGMDLGFVPDGVLTLRVSPNNTMYDDAQTALFYETLLERVRALPGVEEAGAARWLPVVDAGGLWDIAVEHRTFLPGRAPVAAPQEVTPGFFAAMGMTIVAGRELTTHDREGAPRVAVVSRQFARTMWPDEDAVGRRFRLGGLDTVWLTVVGVVEDIRARGFTELPEPTMYIPHAQSARSSYYMPRSMALAVRTGGNPLLLAPQIRDAVRALNAAIPVSRVQTLDDIVSTSTANRRFSTNLISGFAALALVLAGIGIYGVVASGVSQRKLEIGVRVALGASRSRVLGLIAGESVRLAAAGLIIGVVGSLALARAIRPLLVDVPAIDLATLIGVGVLLASVTVLASLVPVRRALMIHPADTLRGDG